MFMKSEKKGKYIYVCLQCKMQDFNVRSKRKKMNMKITVYHLFRQQAIGVERHQYCKKTYKDNWYSMVKAGYFVIFKKKAVIYCFKINNILL